MEKKMFTLEDKEDVGIAADIFGFVTAIGAGTLAFAGGELSIALLLSLAGDIPKPLEAVLHLGAFGIDLAVANAVYEPATAYGVVMTDACKNFGKWISGKIVKAAITPYHTNPTSVNDPESSEEDRE